MVLNTWSVSASSDPYVCVGPTPWAMAPTQPRKQKTAADIEEEPSPAVKKKKASMTTSKGMLDSSIFNDVLSD